MTMSREERIGILKYQSIDKQIDRQSLNALDY